MLKILFITNIPSPYRVDFFNELGKYCELTVLFEKESSSERDDLWKKYKFINFTGIFLKGFSVGVATSICFSVTDYLKQKCYDKIICANFTSPTGLLAIRYMKKHNVEYYLECDGGFAKEGKGIKERIKKFSITGAKGYFSTGEECDKYYLAYGAKKEKIIRYPFSSIFEKEILKEPVSREEKANLRKELGIDDNFTILAVGQFIYRKGFDVLLKSAASIKQRCNIVFVGGNPTEEYLEIKNSLCLNNIYFEGFKNKEELSKYFKASDLFVLPTREDIWGLVINEAIAYGLPIITTNKCVAGLELVKGNNNGCLVEPDNSELLAETITKLIDSKELLSMQKNSLKIARLFTIERMAESHLEI